MRHAARHLAARGTGSCQGLLLYDDGAVTEDMAENHTEHPAGANQ